MKTFQHYLAAFICAILAGICVGLGITAYLSVRYTLPAGIVIGAAVYCISSFAICSRGYYMFTARACRLVDMGLSYLPDLIIMWLGNFAGTGLLALILRGTSLCGETSGLNVYSQAIISEHMDTGFLSLFFLGVLCNLLIYFVADGYRKIEDEAGRYLVIFLGTMTFVMCGMEHSLADMFHLVLSGEILKAPLKCISDLMIITAGNFTGAVAIPLMEKLYAFLILPEEVHPAEKI